MKFIGLLFFCLISYFGLEAQVFSSDKVTVHFFSPAPITNIDALTNSASALINSKKREAKVTIPISSFNFKKALMQQHFNEIYLESNKYPSANFKGVYNENIDFSKVGSYKITLRGKLSMHGVDKVLILPCNLIVKNREITFNSDFKILTKDFKIKLPTILNQEVGQEIHITVNGILSESK